ncbi:MAG: HNH endonuclease signature motif containing protein [Gemmataceae bacterium]
MDAATRAFVRQRAGQRCEHCRLHQDDYEFQTFHVEHIIARQHRGSDDEGNLCLACSECNWAKGPNLAGLYEGELVVLFNPRRQNWNDHFRWDGTLIVGETPTGIVTVQVLDMNSAARLLLRENLLFDGRFPPDA